MIEQAKLAVDGFVQVAFGGANNGIDSFLEDFAKTHGIFSASDTPSNHQLWALYSDSGRGFVVEMDTSAAFFLAPNGRCLLRKVIYTDTQLPDLLQNPLYIFLAKDEGWSFEREWRLLRKLSECDECLASDAEVYVCYAKQGLIKSVLFGYAYDAAALVADAQRITKFDPAIQLRQAYVNAHSRVIEFRELCCMI